MNDDHVANATIDINAPILKVWEALVTPEIIKKYMFGTEVVSDWKEGSSIVWKGEWKGKPYQDKGIILKFVPEKMLAYSHFSPLAGKPDVPENYHTVTIEISSDSPGETVVLLSQDNNSSEEEKGHSEGMWRMMLENLKKTIE